MTEVRPTVWTIAGTDPSGGAGLQTDLRLLSSLDLHVGSVVTAVTAQSLGHFVASVPMTTDLVAQQLAALTLASMPAPRAIKIGMIGSEANAEAISTALSTQQAFVVLDPVIGSTSGGTLADDAAVAGLRRLMTAVDLITPNIPEAERLLGHAIDHPGDLPAAARALQQLGAKQVLIKGGHLGGDLVQDFFLGTSSAVWLSQRREPLQVRGTGCALASAIAGFIALGHNLPESLILAKARITHGIRHAASVGTAGAVLGDLHGPLDAADMPWQTSDLKASLDRPLFPDCGARPLGFYPVVDRSAWVQRCGDLGVTTIQLRVKDLSGKALLREIEDAVAYCHPRGIRLFINDHWQLALDTGAYGVHLGQSDLDQCDLKRLAKAQIRLGISTHSYDEAARAHAIRPSYIALGPIFSTTSKDMPFNPQGMKRLLEWRRLWPYPLVAIGGLTADHADEARENGADGVACISDVTKSLDPDQQIKRWLSRFV